MPLGSRKITRKGKAKVAAKPVNPAKPKRDVYARYLRRSRLPSWLPAQGNKLWKPRYRVNRAGGDADPEEMPLNLKKSLDSLRARARSTTNLSITSSVQSLQSLTSRSSASSLRGFLPINENFNLGTVEEEEDGTDQPALDRDVDLRVALLPYNVEHDLQLALAKLIPPWTTGDYPVRKLSKKRKACKWFKLDANCKQLILKYCFPDGDRKISLSRRQFTEAVFPHDYFANPSDVLDDVWGLLESCRALRKEVYTYFWSQFHFHITVNEFTGPLTSPMSHKWIQPYLPLIQRLTIERDFTRLAGGSSKEATLLNFKVSKKVREMIKTIVDGLKSREEGMYMAELHLMGRKYAGYRPRHPIEVAENRCKVRYVPLMIEDNCAPIGDLKDILIRCRISGFSLEFTMGVLRGLFEHQMDGFFEYTVPSDSAWPLEIDQDDNQSKEANKSATTSSDPESSDEDDITVRGIPLCRFYLAEAEVPPKPTSFICMTEEEMNRSSLELEASKDLPGQIEDQDNAAETPTQSSGSARPSTTDSPANHGAVPDVAVAEIPTESSGSARPSTTDSPANHGTVPEAAGERGLIIDSDENYTTYRAQMPNAKDYVQLQKPLPSTPGHTGNTTEELPTQGQNVLLPTTGASCGASGGNHVQVQQALPPNWSASGNTGTQTEQTLLPMGFSTCGTVGVNHVQTQKDLPLIPSFRGLYGEVVSPTDPTIPRSMQKNDPSLQNDNNLLPERVPDFAPDSPQLPNPVTEQSQTIEDTPFDKERHSLILQAMNEQNEKDIAFQRTVGVFKRLSDPTTEVNENTNPRGGRRPLFCSFPALGFRGGKENR